MLDGIIVWIENKLDWFFMMVLIEIPAEIKRRFLK